MLECHMINVYFISGSLLWSDRRCSQTCGRYVFEHELDLAL